MKDKQVHFEPELTTRQRKAEQALSNVSIRRLLYGGAKGGGKSFFLCAWLFTTVWGMMLKAGLQPSNNPPHVAWFGRKQATDLTATTLQTWRDIIPEDYYKLKGATDRDPKHILIADRIAIDYGGLDKQENINKFNSAEYVIICVDQAEEVTKDEISVLRASLRMIMKDKGGDRMIFPFKELYTANPRNCWLKDDFITRPQPGSEFVSALPADNPHLPDTYIQTLRDSFGHRPELLAAYMMGDWSSIEGADQIILDAWIGRAIGAPTLLGGKIISCDVARFGDDKTIIYLMNGSDILERQEMGHSRTTQVSNVLTELSRTNGNCQIVVDEEGVGGGVIDELVENGRRVIPFCSSRQADDKEKFYNLRAEAWWELGQHFANGEIGCRKMTDNLRTELATPTYSFRNGRILIEPKEKIKERLGRSPDEADAYVMGVWAVKRAMPEIQFAKPSKVQSSYDNNMLTRGLGKRRTG